MSQLHLIEDHYATLGVPPRSDAGAIRAAYLDLMRRFHPDRNDTPEAVERAHAIIAAFAVLGDVEQRLHYDWARRRAAEDAAEAERRRPAMIRKASIAAALVALVMLPLSFIAFSGPDSEPRTTPPAPKVAANTRVPVPDRRPPPDPLVTPAPVASPVPTVAPLPLEPTVVPSPAPKVEAARKAPAPAPIAAVPPPVLPQREKRLAQNALKPPPPAATANPRCRSVKPGAEAAICNNDNLTALDRSVVTFYNQSLRFGDPAKRGALLDARTGFLLKREECRSDACLTGIHLAHLRELSAIVEKGKSGPPQGKSEPPR